MIFVSGQSRFTIPLGAKNGHPSIGLHTCSEHMSIHFSTAISPLQLRLLTYGRLDVVPHFHSILVTLLIFTSRKCLPFSLQH